MIRQLILLLLGKGCGHGNMFAVLRRQEILARCGYTDVAGSDEMTRKLQKHNTIVPAPLGIEPNTIKC
jgi:hypothetical protein